MFENIGNVWQRTSLVQRVILLAVVLALGGAAMLLVSWAKQPKMGTLYTRLSPQEAAKVVDKIRDSGTPYELREGGTQILVPEEKVNQLRLEMAGAGVVSGEGSGGYDLLNDEPIGSSPTATAMRQKRALEGELEKAIGALDGVTKARVIIAKPESSLFMSKDKEVSASVMLTLKNGARPTAGTITSVVNIVSGAVVGLRPDRVMVADSRGTPLSGDASGENKDGMPKTASSYLDYKSQVEDYMARKAQDMLTQVLGPGRATVKVDAVIETANTTETTETYLPDGKVALREEIKSNSTSGAAPKPEVAGSNQKEETTSTDYLVSRTVKSKTDIAGTVKSKTVAVMVDLKGPPDKDGKPAKAALTLEDVKAIVANAIGVSATDPGIKVVDVPFTKPEPIAEVATAEPSMFTREFILDIAKRSSLGLMVIGALLALRMFRGRSAKGGAKVQAQMAGADNMLSADGASDGNPEQLRARISRALQDNPDEVKRLFLSWVEGDKEKV